MLNLLVRSFRQVFIRCMSSVGQEPAHGDNAHGHRRAVLSMVASALCMSLMTLLVKVVNGRIPTPEVVLARSLLGVMLNWSLLSKEGVSPWGKRKGLLFWRGLTSTGALFANYAALSILPLASSTILLYLYPTLTGLLAWIALRERINKSLIAAIVIGWLGVVVVAQPIFLFGGSMALPLVPVLIGVSGALLTALTYVIVRSLAVVEHPLVVVFYFPLIALPVSFPFVCLNPVLPTTNELIMLIGVGIFTQLAQYFLTIGFKSLPAATATSISYVQVFFAVLWGWIFLGEATNQWTLIGAVLVMAASLISLRFASEKRLRRHVL